MSSRIMDSDSGYGTPAETAWLVDASYEAGRIALSLIGENLEPFRWTDSNFQPYYLTDKEQNDVKVVKKVDLFTQNEHTLYSVTVTARHSEDDYRMGVGD